MNVAPLLATRNLSRHFGGLRAVDGVDLHIHAGTLHAIIGPNGAGKTTLLNMLSGALKPTGGRILFQGQDITGQPPHRIAHLGISRSFQITNLFPTLSVLEHARLAAQALGSDNLRLWRDFRKFDTYLKRAWEALGHVGLEGQAHIPASMLPHGDQRRLELATLLAQDPAVMLLDEPTAGLSAEQVPAFVDIIRAIAEEGDKTIVLVEHNMGVVMTLAQRITVMHQGRILAEGPPREIAANEAVQQAYLGQLYGDFADALGEAS